MYDLIFGPWETITWVINLSKAVLSHKQFTFIIYVYLIGAAILFLPEVIFAGRQGWISIIFATLLSLVLMSIWLHLQRKYPGMSLIQYGIKVLGPWLGYPAGFFLVYLMFIISMLIIEDLVILTSTVILPQTPPYVIRATFIGSAVYACYKGVEAIGRMCELAFIPLTLLIVSLPLLQWADLRLAPLQPLLQIDWYGVAIGTANGLVFPFLEVVFPMVLLPFVSVDVESEKYYYFAIIGAGLMLIIKTMVVLMVIGPEIITILTLPIVTVFRVAEIGAFFNRIEGLFLGIWYIGLLMKLAITLYVGGLGLAQLTGVKRLENLWLPIGALMFFVTQLRFLNQADFSFFSFYVLPFLALPGEILYPVIILLVSSIRGTITTSSHKQPQSGA